jgi:carbamoylphosphate synthase large subunit
MSDDTAARISAVEARVAALEAINVRLVGATTRLFDLLADRVLWATEELIERDIETAETQVELEAKIRSRAPKGFRFPVVVHSTVVENRPSHFWVAQNYYQMKAWMRIMRLEELLEKKGVISSVDQSDLAVGGGNDSVVFERRMAEHFPDYDNPENP